MKTNQIKILLPFLLALAIVFGIFIGFFYAKRLNPDKITDAHFDKVDALFQLIQQNYVDSVDINQLTEDAFPHFLAQLDPHSVYIPKSELTAVNEDLEGSFSGIGVQFNIQNDTVMIVAVINGGPSEKIGILPGDRIVQVNDSSFVGPKINNDKVFKALRGKINTKVRVGIKRNGAKDMLSFDIVRSEIPVNSVDVSYKLENNIGYVKVSKFGATTYDEFFAAIRDLKKQNCEKIIVDLRGNPGGYMDAAVAMVNEFLPKESLIVYTEGKSFKRINNFADGRGLFLDAKIAVLIDEWSASASEIFAGAIQDNDRGIILGRRSFGKGLVQSQIPFPDSTAVRLTVARYFTPSGRCIQKPYEKGNDVDYENEIKNRYLHGELDTEDSVKMNQTQQYKTKKGRIVYAGGGIMPDVFIPRDTSYYTTYYNKLVNYSYIYQYAFNYVDKNRTQLQKYNHLKDLLDYLHQQNLMQELASFAETKGLIKNPHSLKKSAPLIQNLIDAYIVRNLLGDKDFYFVLNQTDVVIKKAVEHLSKEE